MSSTDKLDFEIDTAYPHTVKKFELIEKYATEWAVKLLNFGKSKGIIFIDCMSNCGHYVNINGEDVYGTPVRVARELSLLADANPSKTITVYFNDISQRKISYLQTLLPQNQKNFLINLSHIDGNDLLKRVHAELPPNTNCLLVYDPYEAAIDWSALAPFLNIWGEVIVNHMVSDSKRGVSQARRPAALAKYGATYQKSIEELRFFSGTKDAFEQRIQNIIIESRGQDKKGYFISSFPFFNRKNQVVYNLIHCSGNIKGRRLFKKIAWDTFGGKSSLKDTHGKENQFILDFENDGEQVMQTDDHCYYVQDIAQYIYDAYKGRASVALGEIYALLDDHPIFPSDGYKTKIKDELKKRYNAHVSTTTITFC